MARLLLYGGLLLVLSLIWLVSERLLIALLVAGSVVAWIVAPPRWPRTRGAWIRAAASTTGVCLLLAFAWLVILSAAVVTLNAVDHYLLNP